MTYLLDTNICIYIINRHPPALIRQFKQLEIGSVAVSSITISELEYGASKSKNSTRNHVRLQEFLAPLEILAYDEEAAHAYGQIRFLLEQKGRPIAPLDLLIAAHALSRRLVLVTNNEREFIRVPGLQVENWLQ